MPAWMYMFLPGIATQARGRGRRSIGSLTVTVVRASGLRASDFAVFRQATSDPYAVLSFGSHIRESKQTKCVRENLNPEWNETFRFDVQYPWSTLRVTVFDYDRGSNDVRGSMRAAWRGCCMRAC